VYEHSYRKCDTRSFLDDDDIKAIRPTFETPLHANVISSRNTPRGMGVANKLTLVHHTVKMESESIDSRVHIFRSTMYHGICQSGNSMAMPHHDECKFVTLAARGFNSLDRREAKGVQGQVTSASSGMVGNKSVGLVAEYDHDAIREVFIFMIYYAFMYGKIQTCIAQHIFVQV